MSSPEPRTEAGRRLWATWDNHATARPTDAILAIEDEATGSAIERIVEGLNDTVDGLQRESSTQRRREHQMNVYLVIEDDYNQSFVHGVFASRDGAEAYCVDQQRGKWQKLVDRTGEPVPGSGQWKFMFNPNTGESSSELVAQDVYEHPGPFESWVKQPENETDLRILEHTVITDSP